MTEVLKLIASIPWVLFFVMSVLIATVPDARVNGKQIGIASRVVAALVAFAFLLIINAIFA